MSKQQETFVFIGDTEVGSVLSDRLALAGYAAAFDLDQADIVFTYSPVVSKLEDLYFETNGIMEKSKSGAIFVDLSPATPAFARELYALARVNERFALDAPLVVHDMVDEEAFSRPENLTCLVGGDEDDFKRVEALLNTLAQNVVFLGGAGAGQSAKTAATLQTAASLIAAVEARTALSLSETPVNETDVFDLLTKTGLVAPSLARVVEAMQHESFKGSFTVGLLLGEVAAALEAVDDHDLILPQAEAGFRLIELLAFVGGVDYNPAAMTLAFTDDETCKRFNLDWNRAEGLYEHDHDHDHDHEHDHSHSHSHDHASDFDDDYDYDDGYESYEDYDFDDDRDRDY